MSARDGSRASASEHRGRLPGSGPLSVAAIEGAFASERAARPGTHAFWLYDPALAAERARRFLAAFAPLEPHVGYALKANAHPAFLARFRELGLAAEAGSLGELESARAQGFPPGRTSLNGNGRTVEEAAWVARHGVHSVNADHVPELDLLEREAARAGARIRVALRINFGIDTPGHRYVATGDEGAKFGVAPSEALEAWAARARWPHLELDGLHVHVGSQLLDPAPLEQALDLSLALAAESAARGAPLGLLNLGGGFGVDYAHEGRDFPLEAHAARVADRVAGLRYEWALEPGRWIVAPAGVLVSEVLWVKRRGSRRFVVLACGMNDLIRPALYHARHRIVPLRPRAGDVTPACVVGPVCESGDVFDEACPLPPLEPGDLVAILDAGAYAAAMSSRYNGRPPLEEVVAS